MSDFYRRFLTEDGRRLEPETGRYVALGAFGKHPGWDDHIEDLGLDTESLNLAKRVFYVRGVGGQIDTGAWEKLKEEQRLAAFDHTFVWLRGSQFLIGRMWSSSDGKGRTRYPMILCAHCIGTTPKWALQTILPRLLEVERECRAAQTAGEVRVLLSVARARLGNAARTSPEASEAGPPSPAVLNEFVAAPALGPANEGWLRLLYWMQSQLTGFAPGRYEIKEDMSVYRAQQVRVPLGVNSPADAVALWTRFFAGYVDARVPLLFLWPADGNWLDVAFGEPSSQEFFCLRASRAALPLVTEIPYELDEKFRQQAKKRVADFQNGVAPAGPITRPSDARTDANNVSATQRWFKTLAGKFFVVLLVVLLLAGVAAAVIYLRAPAGQRAATQPQPARTARSSTPEKTAAQAQPGIPAKTVSPGKSLPVSPPGASVAGSSAAPPTQAAAVAQKSGVSNLPTQVKNRPLSNSALTTPPPVTNQSLPETAEVAKAPAPVVAGVTPATNPALPNTSTGAQVQAQSPVKVITNGIGMVLLWVAGLPDSNGGGYVGKYEVTQAEYEKVTGANPSQFKDPAGPVENVSWNDALEFCRKLNAAESQAARLPPGFAYGLPTQRQWDFFLDDASFDQAVTSRNQAGIRPSPSKVGTMPPNQFGLCDVLGNIWEWCADSDSPGQKVLKGGAYNNGKIYQFRPLDRTSVRLAPAELKASDAGLRCVLTHSR